MRVKDENAPSTISKTGYNKCLKGVILAKRCTVLFLAHKLWQVGDQTTNLTIG